jgi:nucleoside-diphosphate-sugar epimerase
MSPESPLAATDVKGVVRARMWTDALAAHEAGRVRVTEARAADFVGPQVPGGSSHLGRQLPALRKGRRAWVIGDPDVARSWGYLPDVAATLATLGTDERSLGRAWHVPSAPPRSQRQALTDLAEAMRAAPVRVSGIAWPVLRAVGLVVPMMREVVDVRHQFDQEFVIDATATTATFELTATPWEEVVRATVAGTPVTV